MLKRTLWYACLVLLCCGISVLVVLATSAGKTTLVPTDTNSSATRSAVGGLFSPSVPVAGNPVAKPRQPLSEQERLRSDVPSPSTHLDVPEVVAVEKASKETKSEAQGEAAEKERIETREVAPPEPVSPVDVTLRKELELQARGMGYDPDLISALSDADLRALVAGAARRTSEIKTEAPPSEVEATAADAPRTDRAALDELKPEEQAKLAEAARGPVALTEAPEKPGLAEEATGAAPVFGSAGESAGGTLGGPEPEKVATPAAEPEHAPVFETSGQAEGDVITGEETALDDARQAELKETVDEIIARDQAGGTLTPEEKAVLSAYSRTLPVSESPHGRVTLDDNGGVTYVYAGAILRVPPTGTGGTDTTFAPITVAGSSGPILDVEVEIDSLSHQFPSDCDIFLRSPAGTTCELSTDNGGYDESYYAHLRFDDDAANSITTATSGPITGTYSPEGLLSVFDNESADGIWNLIVYDDANIDTGSLVSWRVQILTANGLYTNDFFTTRISSPQAGTTYAPSSSVTVTASFMNYGSATQTSPVKYQFNAGTVVTEATASLVQYATESHSFGTQITMPGTPGDYELVVWSDLTTDEDRSNDTLRRSVHVALDGFACATAYSITTVGPDSFTFNNTGAGDNTPGQVCWPSNSYSDMVFKMTVPNGQQGEIWKAYSSALDFTQTVRWGGACPGTNLLYCWDTPDYKKFRIVNHSGADQDLYFTGGGYSSSGVGSFKMAWWRQTAATYTPPYSCGFEITVDALSPYYTTFPNFWSVENSNGDTAYIWENSTTSPYSGGYCARMYKYGQNNDWLFSPGLNLTHDSTYYVEYWRKSYSASYPESLEVKAGTQNTSAAMTTTVVAWDSFKTTSWVKKYGTFVAGTTAPYYIGFHSYTRTPSAYGGYLDSVRVLPLFSNDFETLAITAPSGLQAPNATANVTATFRNFGGTAQTCPVKYQFNGGGIVTEATASLTTLQTESHTFATQITMPASPGVYSLVVWTDLATDQNRASDTARINVYVNLSGWDCDNYFTVTTAGADSFLFNNTGAGNNTPGQWCAGTSSYNDMVFKMTVPTDQQGEFWLTSALTNYHSLKWGGACAGTTPIACISTSYPLQKLRYVNHTGSDEDIWFVIGGSSTTAGNFKLAWQRQATATYNIPYANGFEITVVQPTNPTYHTLPNFWSIENSNSDAYTWENSTSSPAYGGYCARSYAGGTAGNDDWLFTPGLNLTNGNSYYVEYWRKAYSSSYAESLEVKVGTVNNSTAMTTTVVPWDSFKTTSWVKKYGYFTAGSTAPYYIGFHSWTRRQYGGSYLDSLRVVAMQSNDFRTLAITSPTTTMQPPSSSVNVTATFQNFGSVTQTCPVKYQFDVGGAVTEATASLTPLQQESHTFGTQITMPATPDTYELVVWTDLVADQDRSNDTIRMNVIVGWDGFACATVYPITTVGPDSATFNNTGAVNNTPGIPCFATCYSDMVFKMTVPNGQQGEIWKAYSSGQDFTQAVRWGGGCPGTNLLYCWDFPDYKKFRIVNNSGADQDLYFTCGGYSSSYVGAFKVAWWRQPAAVYTPPYSNGFEITVNALSPYYTTFPDFWSVENSNGDTAYIWENSTTSPYSGGYCARIYKYGFNNDWLFTPGLLLTTGTTYYLDFFRKAYSGTYPESLEVKIGTQNVSAAMTATLMPFDSNKTTAWVEKATPFTVSVPDTYYIGFHSYTHVLSAYGGYLDSVNVYNAVCGAPAVTVNPATGTTFVTLTATATGGWGGPLQYQWFTGISCHNGSQIAGANLSTYLATASGNYSVRVWRADSVNCAGCDSAQVTLSSPCAPIIPPYVENFDTTGGAWATCWSQVNANSDATLWAPSTTNPLNGAYCMYIAGTVNGNDDWLFSEPLSLTQDTTYVLEYWRRSVHATYYDSLEVKYGSVRLPIAMTNTILAPDTCKNTAYQLRSALFIPAASGTYHIGFHSMTKGSISAGTRIDSVRVIQGICGAPTVTVNAATGTNTALLTANATGGYGGALQYQWFTGLACQDGNQIQYAIGSTYLATASGIYSVLAWRRDSVACGACDSALVTLSSPCVATVPEYIENFDTTAGTWSDCWSQENRNGDATVWAPNTSLTYNGTPNCMYIAGTAAGNDDWLFSEPVILSSDTTYVLEYWRRSTSSSYYDSMRVMYGTQRASGAMLYVIFPPDTSKTTTYVQKAAPFTPPATATYYIGFHNRNNSSSAYTRIDSVHLYVYGPCGAPSVTVNSAVSTYSVTLLANASGGHGGPLRYQWYTNAPPQVGNEIVGQTNPTYTATVSGDYSCTAARGPVDSTQCSAWDSATVTLTCATGTVPMYFQNFDGVTPPALPACWSQENTNGDSYYWYTYAGNYHSSPNCVYIAYNGSAAMNDWLFSSRLQLSADSTYNIEYWYRGYGSLRESLEVKVGPQPNSASMTTTLRAGFGFFSSTYTRDVVSFTPPSTGTYHFGWHGCSITNQWYIYMDDIRIYAQGNCDDPDSVRVTATAGEDSVTLTANVYGGYGGSPQYHWFTGVGCQAGNEIVGANLATYKTYVTGDFSCRAWLFDSLTCYACDSGHAEVINCATNSALPLVEGFEARATPNLPFCWKQQDVNNDSYYWYTSTSYPHSGTKHAYIYTYAASGSAANDWLFTRRLQLQGDSTYRVGYWYRAGSTSYTEKLEVKLGRSQVADSMIVATVDPEFTFTTTTYTYREIPFVAPATGVYYLGWHATSGSPTSYQYGYIYLDDIIVFPNGMCDAPDSVKVNSPMGADFAWMKCTVWGGYGGAPVYQWYTGATCQTGNEIGGANLDSVQVTTSGTYSCKVYRVSADTCAGCASGTATVINCATGLTPAVRENFDRVTAPALPACWTQQDVNGDGYYWKTYTSNYRSSPNCAYINYNGSQPHNDWLFSVRLNLSSDTTYTIEYWYRSYGSTSSPDCMEVKIGTAADAGSMTTSLRAPMQLTSSTYQKDSLTFTPPSTGGYFVGWHAMSRADMWYIYVDDVLIRAQGSCGLPDSVRANAGYDTIYVKLTANVYGGFGTGPTYQWYTGLGCQSGNEVSGATAQDYYATATGIYSVSVSFGTGCTVCDSAMATVVPDTCSPVTYIVEGFESTTGTALPTCWSYQDLYYTSVYWWTTTTTPHSGLRDVYIYGYGPTYYADDWMYTKPIILQGGISYDLAYWRRNSSSTYADSLEIKYGTLPVNVAMTNVIAAADTNKTTTWVFKGTTFTPSVTDTYYIGFHCMSRWYTSSAYTYIDDIGVWPTGSCAPADSVRANAASGNIYVKLTANVYGGYGAGPTYQWYTGLGCQSGNEISGANARDYYALSSGIYSVSVSFGTGCTVCDSAMATVAPDPCSAATLPYYENFDGVTAPTLPTCWTQEDANGDGYFWKTYTTYYRSSPNCTYIPYNGSGPMNDWLFSQKLNLQAGTTYYIDYWYRGYGSLRESLEVKIGSLPVSAFQTTTLHAGFGFNQSTYLNDVLPFTPTSTGTYYVGWHGVSISNQWYIYLDDVTIYTGCGAPTVTVNDCTVTTGSPTLIATLTGGWGAPIVYQWYHGSLCVPGNAIPGANSSVYVACVSDTYACRVYRGDSVICVGCDSGIATIGTTPPNGYDCCHPIYLTGTDSAAYNNTGMGDTSPGQICGASGNDMVFGLIVPANYTGRIHKTTLLGVGGTIDSRTSLMATCGDLSSTFPGSGLSGYMCIDDPDTTWWSYTNCTGVTDTVYFVIGNYYTGATAGPFTVAWQITTGSVCPDISCTPTVTESEPSAGCGNDNLFTTITCGDVVGGSLTATTTLRDVDAFQLTLAEPKNLTVTIEAEFDLALQMRTDTVGTACPDVYLDAMDNVVCGTESRVFYNVPAGLVNLTIYPPFKETCGSRDYCMTVTCAAATVPPGEDCSNPIVLTPPGSGGSTQVLGNNQGYLADYPDTCEYPGLAADVMYSLTISSCRRLTFSLDTSGSTVGNDKFIEVFESGRCGGDAFLCDDDRIDFDTLSWEGVGQRPVDVLSSFCGGELPAGTYYIRVSNASTGPGPYKLTVYDNGPCACDITCQGGDALETTENRYDPTFYLTDPDGGCFITPPAFGAINCGSTLCGVGFNYQRKGIADSLYRDTDWYLFTIATRRVVTLTVNAEFPAIIVVVDTNGCLTPVALFGDSTVPACTPTAVSDTLDPGTYAAAIAPRYSVGNPLPSTYRATLSCICIPGRKPTDVTCRFDSADGTPIGSNYWNDIRIRWTADSAMAGIGTFTLYYNLNDNSFPGGTGWTLLASGITPVLGPHNTTYVDLNVVNASIVRRFYVVVAVCE